MSEPSRKPKKISPEAWWYEDEGGIRVIQECHRPYADGGLSGTRYCATWTARIPWAKLLKAARRCGKLK